MTPSIADLIDELLKKAKGMDIAFSSRMHGVASAEAILMRQAADALKSLQAERDQIERNRDMWKGQCEQQATNIRQAREDVRLWKGEAMNRSESMVQLNLDRAAMGVELMQAKEALAAAQETIGRYREITDAVREALSFGDVFQPDDASLNLQGVADDLQGRWDHKDGGVCVGTINRVIGQLESARKALETEGVER